MRQSLAVNQARLFFVALAFAAIGSFGFAADSSRFSLRISTAERAETGVGRLSSDQVAILDALIRRDTIAFLTGSTEPDAPAKFSLRLSADERRNAGLELLTADEIARIDALVQSTQVPKSTASLLSPPPLLSSSPVRVLEKKKEREIHGSVSLTYGWGGGTNVKSGSMIMTMEDPDKHYSVTIGYTETHVKGPNGYYRGDYIGDGPGMLPYRGDPFRP